VKRGGGMDGGGATHALTCAGLAFSTAWCSAAILRVNAPAGAGSAKPVTASTPLFPTPAPDGKSWVKEELSHEIENKCERAEGVYTRVTRVRRRGSTRWV
jgi:hypothetical protein